MSRAAHAAGAGRPAASPAPVATPATVPVAKSVITVTNYVVEAKPESVRSAVVVTNEYFCKGYVMFGKNDGMVILSNGSGADTTVDIASGRIQRIETTCVVVDGVKLPIRRGEVFLPSAPALKNERSVEGDLTPPVIQQVEPPPPFGGIVVTPAVGGAH